MRATAFYLMVRWVLTAGEICTTQEQRYPGGKCGPAVHWRGRDLRLYGHGHYLVRMRDVVYIAPALLLHYILYHHYRPPEEFVEAVVMGSFLTPEDPLFVPLRIVPRPGADEGWTQDTYGRAPEETVSVPSGIVFGPAVHGSGMTQRSLDSLLRWGIVFSIFWLAGAGSLFALLAGLRAKREIAQSGGESGRMGTGTVVRRRRYDWTSLVASISRHRHCEPVLGPDMTGTTMILRMMINGIRRVGEGQCKELASWPPNKWLERTMRRRHVACRGQQRRAASLAAQPHR